MNHIPLEPPARYETRAAIHHLNGLLGFVEDPEMQDWDVQRADLQRLDEFVNAYRASGLNDDERFLLMKLIVASADNAMSAGSHSRDQWREISSLLVADAALHASTIYYWCCVSAAELDECFPLTPLMRDVWNQAFPGDRFQPV